MLRFRLIVAILLGVIAYLLFAVQVWWGDRLPKVAGPVYPYCGGRPATERDIVRASPRYLQDSRMVVDRFRSPSTLGAAVAQSDAIVVAKIVRQDFRVPDLERCGMVYTLATATVKAVIKDDQLLAERGGRITVVRLGGAWWYGAVLIHNREEAFAPFVTGSEYVLFLRKMWWGRRWPTGVWYPALDDDATFQVLSDRSMVVPLGPADRLGIAPRGYSLEEFTTELRALAEGHGESVR